MSSVPAQFENVTVVTKANVYFGGKVVSHTVKFSDGQKRTLGLIFPGAFTFDTQAPELMEITAGTCQVKLKGSSEWTTYGPGTSFKVPGQSAFEISVDQGVTEYLCSFLG